MVNLFNNFASRCESTDLDLAKERAFSVNATEYAKTGDCGEHSYNKKDFLMFVAAARGGFKDVLIWLESQGSSLGRNACEAAARGGHLEVLKWLRSEGCPWNVQKCIHAAAESQKVEVSEWIRSFLPSGNKPIKSTALKPSLVN